MNFNAFHCNYIQLNIFQSFAAWGGGAEELQMLKSLYKLYLHIYSIKIFYSRLNFSYINIYTGGKLNTNGTPTTM